MKGVSMPINMVVTIAIVVLVLVMVGAFFLIGSGEQFEQFDAQKVFSQGCDTYCENKCDALSDAGLGCGITNTDPFCTKFQNACKSLGYISTDSQIGSCLRACDDSCNPRNCPVPSLPPRPQG